MMKPDARLGDSLPFDIPTNEEIAARVASALDTNVPKVQEVANPGRGNRTFIATTPEFGGLVDADNERRSG